MNITLVLQHRIETKRIDFHEILIIDRPLKLSLIELEKV